MRPLIIAAIFAGALSACGANGYFIRLQSKTHDNAQMSLQFGKDKIGPIGARDGFLGSFGPVTDGVPKEAVLSWSVAGSQWRSLVVPLGDQVPPWFQRHDEIVFELDATGQPNAFFSCVEIKKSCKGISKKNILLSN